MLDNFWPKTGGVEHAFGRIADGMVARGHEVVVVTHRLPDTPSRQYRGGVRIVRSWAAGNRMVFTATAIPDLLREIRRADIVHASTFNAAPPAWIVSSLLRKPMVLTVNETWIGKWREYTNVGFLACFYEMAERVIFSFPYPRYVSISRATATRLAEVVPRSLGRSSVVYFGFDEEPWRCVVDVGTRRADLGVPDKAFFVFAYGRAGLSKGFDVLIRAFDSVVARVPGAVLLLALSAGEQERSDLSNLMILAGSSVRIIPPMSFDDLIATVKVSDCLVVPSLAEGFGYTTLEAGVAGIPFVATSAGSIPEVVGGRYVLVNPGSVEDLADGIVSVSRGSWVQTPVSSFPWQRCIDEYESLYLDLLHQRI